MDVDEPSCPLPSPCPRPPSSILLKDISNFKTPKRPSQPQNFYSPCPQQFYTASKQTPKSSASSFRRRGPPSALSKSRTKTAVARRLKSLEEEQSKSAYKSQLKKEQSLKSLSKSLTVWLNFLVQNPKLCGCDNVDISNGVGTTAVVGQGKREGGEMMTWRTPKRQRDLGWKGGNDEVEGEAGFSENKYSMLRNSLKDVCSFEDLKQRMRVYLSLSGCKEIFDVMSHVIKNIDEGRLKMKSHCPIVTDFGMKEKATGVLMNYNPFWLRIGLYIIFGGDSLLSNEDSNCDQEMAFLKMMIEKHFFSHAGLAKAYAYNKKVEGLYRPGYYEALGSVILKRSLLLVLILDRAKSQSLLPLKYGIDGVDGGSPVLFSVQSIIKSSRQVIVDFLSSDVMHGEGNLLAHLVIIGYKVSYQQSPLAEYDFRVKDLFVDLQDGVRLGRITQLLLQDSSILMKMVVPSDTRKKSLMNCGIALQYLRKAGVKLFDEDGTPIMEDDVSNGDKELIISLLWNMFVHLQLPLLINRNILLEEICKIHSTSADHLNSVSSTLDLLLNWIQVVCEKYDFEIANFASLVDGKAIWCLLDFYFRKEICCSCLKDNLETRGEESIMSSTDYTDAFHNFILSQKLTTLLGNFPEVLQMSDILEHNGACSDRSVVILLVFLSSQLIVKKNMDQLNFHKLLGCDCQSLERRRSNTGRWIVNSEALSGRNEENGDSTEDAVRNFKDLQAWWREMAEKNHRSASKSRKSTLKSFSASKNNVERGNAAKVIEFHFNTSEEKLEHSEKHERFFKFIVERHGLGKLERSVLLIQRAARIWIIRKHQARGIEIQGASSHDLRSGGMGVQKCVHTIVEIDKTPFICQENGENELKTGAVLKIQFAWRSYISSKSLRRNCFAATKIQTHFRGWQLRQRFLNQKQATIRIQSNLRCLRCWRTFQQYKVANRSAIVIQSHVRGWQLRQRFLKQKQATIRIQSNFRRLRGWRTFQRYKVANRSAIIIQCHVRGWQLRQRFLNQKQATIRIQSNFRRLRCWRTFQLYKVANRSAIVIQSHVRGWQLRQKFLNQKQASIRIQSNFRCLRCWRTFQQYNVANRSAIVIQSHVRGWIARRGASKIRNLVVIIQRHFRGWLMRREFLFQRESIIKIQSAIRCLKCCRAFHFQRQAAIEVQRFVRGHIVRRRLLAMASGSNFNALKGSFQSFELERLGYSALKLQRWWRHVLLLKLKTKSAIIIQSHFRGWAARKRASREKHRIAVVQAYWKGYLARKESSRQILDLRLRVQKSATNVDDGMRLINRLLLALSELLSMKSVSGILHTCATLDMATEHSQKCCEKLVAAGAINTLLKLIRSVSRSIPDQEVLKHALSTLRNLARFPHLVEVLIDSQGSVETILWEMLRNKDEGYFIASDILKKICSNHKGVQAISKLPSHLKRLNTLAEELTRKASFEKRNPRNQAVRDNLERRMREAVELLKLLKHG